MLSSNGIAGMGPSSLRLQHQSGSRLSVLPRSITTSRPYAVRCRAATMPDDRNPSADPTSPSTPGQAGRNQPGPWDLDRLFDTNWWHYTPAWYKPKYVILAGVSFILSANMAGDAGLKTTVMAAVPVGFAWFLFLWMVPRQFREFAHKYVAAHPECEAKERERARVRAAATASMDQDDHPHPEQQRDQRDQQQARERNGAGRR